MLETSESDTILNSNFSDGTKDNESTWSSKTDSLCVTVLTPGPSRIQFDIMAQISFPAGAGRLRVENLISSCSRIDNRVCRNNRG